MMSEEELDDLAADIKASGLLHPIFRDIEGRIVDRRNLDALPQAA
jgi:ParB-like chromosome segregation protein Spo0J